METVARFIAHELQAAEIRLPRRFPLTTAHQDLR